MGRAFKCDVCGGLLEGDGKTIQVCDIRPDLRVNVEVFAAEKDGAGKITGFLRGPVCSTCGEKLREQIAQLPVWGQLKKPTK